MTTLSVYNAISIVDRCDSKCHNAESLECLCICRGRCHGQAIGRVREFTNEIFLEILQDNDGVLPVFMEKLSSQCFGGVPDPLEIFCQMSLF